MRLIDADCLIEAAKTNTYFDDEGGYWTQEKVVSLTAILNAPTVELKEGEEQID